LSVERDALEREEARAKARQRGLSAEFLIGDVLDTSRIEAGTFSFTFRDVELSDLLREVVAAAELGQDEVRVIAEVNGALPKVRGDRERLRQVVQNLVDNAVKYSPAGGEVRVRATADDGRVLVEVEDAGPGISLDDQQLIFTKFGREGLERDLHPRNLDPRQLRQLFDEYATDEEPQDEGFVTTLAPAGSHTAQRCRDEVDWHTGGHGC